MDAADKKMTKDELSTEAEEVTVVIDSTQNSESSVTDQSKNPYMVLAREWEGLSINPEFIELWHIKKIDGIPANTFIRKWKGEMTLNIVSQHVKDANTYDNALWEYYKSDKLFYDKVEDIASILETFANTIGELRYNKYNCKLDFKNKIQVTESMITLFGGSSSTVEVAKEKCCICHEETCVLTKCDHHVCVPCADQYIDKNRKATCPICRNKNGLGRLKTCSDNVSSNYTSFDRDYYTDDDDE